MPHTPLEQLLQRPDIWQSGRRQPQVAGTSTGFSQLDNCLHLGGWPSAGLVEILCKQQGIGELQILLPTLARASSAGRHCLLLAPPYIPYPAALKAAGVCVDKVLVVESYNTQEQLWCAEQALRANAAGCLIAWFGSQQLQTAHLRKLLLAAKQSDTLLFLQRHTSVSQQASPANLRLLVGSAKPGEIQLQILKQTGGWAGQELSLPRRETWLATSRWHLPLTLQSGTVQAATRMAHRRPQTPHNPRITRGV